MNKKLVLALMGMGAAGIASAATITMTTDMGVVTDGNDIHHLQSNYTMVSTNEYILDGRLLVDPGYSLTIEPGTVIRCAQDLNDPGALFIDRGAKIYANGAEGNPIIFTDMNDSNVPGSTPVAPYDAVNNVVGQWGGVVFCGKAFLNANVTGTGAINYDTVSVEGVPVSAGIVGGGANDDDSSGVFKYVSIRYNGFKLGDGDELNGLSLYGVGRGTEIHHVESINSQDDGVEFFGGTVNTKNMIIWSAGDDSFDLDHGHRGKHQFVFVVQGSNAGKIGGGVSDKGMEIDGSNDDKAQPFGLFRIYNATLIGKGMNGTAASIAENTALNIRDNAGPQIFNSVFMDFGGAGATIEWRDDKSNSFGYNDAYTRFGTTNDLASLPSSAATNYLGEAIGAADFYQAQEAGNQGMIADCIFWGFGLDVRPTIALGYDYATYWQDGAFFDLSCVDNDGTVAEDNFDFLASEFNNTVDQSGTGTMPIVSLDRGPAIGLAGEEVNVPTNINPRAAGDALTSSRTPEADGFFSPVNYKGAFSSSYNWAEGWTFLDSVGMFDGQSANPSAPDTSIQLVGSAVSFDTVNGVSYTVESSDDLTTWVPEATVSGDGTNMTVAEIVGSLDSSKMYRVVVQ